MKNHDAELKEIINKTNQYLNYFHMKYTMVKDHTMRLFLLDNIAEYAAILEQDYEKYRISLNAEAEEVIFLENIKQHLQQNNITQIEKAIDILNGLKYQLADDIHNTTKIEEFKTQISSAIEIFGNLKEEDYIGSSNPTKIDGKLLQLKENTEKDDIIKDLQNISHKITCLLNVANLAENIATSAANDSLGDALQIVYRDYDLCMRGYAPMMFDLMLYDSFLQHTVEAFAQIKSLALSLAEAKNIAQANDFEFIFNDNTAAISERQIGISFKDYGYTFLLKYDEESVDFVAAEKLELINLIKNTMLIEDLSQHNIRFIEKNVDLRANEIGILQHDNNKLLIKINYLESPMLSFIPTKEQHPYGISTNLYHKLSNALAKQAMFDEQPIIFTNHMIPTRLYVKIKEQILELIVSQEDKPGISQELFEQLNQGMLKRENLDFLDLRQQSEIITFIENNNITTKGLYVEVKDKPALELTQAIQPMLYEKIQNSFIAKQCLILSFEEKLEIINFTYKNQLTGIFSLTQETINVADQLAWIGDLFNLSQEIISLMEQQSPSPELCQEIAMLNDQGKSKISNTIATTYTPITNGLFQMFAEVDQMRKAAIELCQGDYTSANNVVGENAAEVLTLGEVI